MAYRHDSESEMRGIPLLSLWTMKFVFTTGEGKDPFYPRIYDHGICKEDYCIPGQTSATQNRVKRNRRLIRCYPDRREMGTGSTRKNLFRPPPSFQLGSFETPRLGENVIAVSFSDKYISILGKSR